MIPTIELLRNVFVEVHLDNFFLYFYFLSFIIQTMCSIVAHENEFQLLFQKFAFACHSYVTVSDGSAHVT